MHNFESDFNLQYGPNAHFKSCIVLKFAFFIIQHLVCGMLLNKRYISAYLDGYTIKKIQFD